MNTCKGFYYSGCNELVWRCECGIEGPWGCDKFIADTARANAAKQAVYNAEVDLRVAEGRNMYKNGLPPAACRVQKMEANRTEKNEPCENIDRLVGYLDEMRQDIRLFKEHKHVY